MAIIGDCGYWPYTSGRSVRLYTDECVVDSGTGLMGPCTRLDDIIKGINGLVTMFFLIPSPAVEEATTTGKNSCHMVSANKHVTIFSHI